MNERQILIVEDDPQIRNFIQYTLKREGYSSLTAGTAQGAMSILVRERIDVVLLDLGLPDYDGLEVIQKLRQWWDGGILVVSARDQDREKAAALDAGADDYLTKPFSATELMARLRVTIRHLSRSSGTPQICVLRTGQLTMDLDKRLVTLEGQPIHLTPMEYNLLQLLFRNLGKVLTTKTIRNEIYGVGYGTDTQALRTLTAALRRKIEKTPAVPQYLITEIGVGYRLADLG